LTLPQTLWSNRPHHRQGFKASKNRNALRAQPFKKADLKMVEKFLEMPKNIQKNPIDLGTSEKMYTRTLSKRQIKSHTPERIKKTTVFPLWCTTLLREKNLMN